MPKKIIPPPIKLDLSFGPLPPNHPFARAIPDPLSLPWKLRDNSVEEACSAYFFNRVPSRLRGRFMDELHRVLVPGGKATFIVPYWTSPRSIQDPMSEWPPFSEHSFLYFNKTWRQANAPGYEMACDFDFTYGFLLDAETQMRTTDVHAFWIKHYVSAVNDLQVVLTKKTGAT